MSRQFCISLVLIVLVGGCTPAWKKPEPIEQVGLLENAVSQTVGDVTVTVAVPTRDQTTRLFGTSLYSDRIQPVWFSVDNRSDKPFLIMKMGVDKDHYSPLEAAFQRHSGSKETRQEMNLFFHQMGFKNPVLPGEVVTGYVFTNLDEGFKPINVDLVSDRALLNFSFVVDVPGLVTDVDHVDLDALYDEWVHIEDEMELRRALESLPCCTTDKQGDRFGDPLNVVFIGDRAEMFAALIRRGWHQTEITHARSAWRTVKSFLFGSQYRYSPISSLYVFGRSQDLGLQKARDTIHLRNHMRIWRTPYLYRGKEVYIGQISRDVGVKFNKRTITTHAIDPDIDDTRDSLAGDMAYSQSMHAWGYVKGSRVSTFEDTHYNLTPDPYYSDGLRLVMFFGTEPVNLSDIHILDWELNERLMNWQKY
jgi:hypothetical protein